MSDPIKLLEAVGRDASLRHLPPEQLRAHLAGQGASEGLLATIASGDRNPLRQEMAIGGHQQPQASNVPFREEDDELGEDGEAGELPVAPPGTALQ